MRYIFTAAIGTILVIAALMALPPIGQPETGLVAESAGDRLATEAESALATASVSTVERQLVTPSSTTTTTALLTEVLGLVTIPGDLSARLDVDRPALIFPEPPATTTEAPLDAEARSLGVDDATDVAEESSTTTTATAAPEPTTTEAAPAPAADPVEEPVEGDGGVIISPRGVVLPIIGPGADGGWRATTPCGNEVTMHDGQRVTSVDFVIDAGHGGSEPGAFGPSGSVEKDLNLRIAEIVEWYLEEAGYSVLLTRTTDIRLPLQSRADIAVALNPDAFVSIHHNGGATRPQSTPGSEMFVDGGNPEARRLGGLLFEEMIDHMSAYDAQWVGSWRNGVGTRLNSSGDDLYGIHRYTPGIPSVITEVGYMTNPSEEALYVDNEVQWSHAKAIADGLIRWSTSADTGHGYLDDFVDDSSSGTGGFQNCTDPSL